MIYEKKKMGFDEKRKLAGQNPAPKIEKKKVDTKKKAKK